MSSGMINPNCDEERIKRWDLCMNLEGFPPIPTEKPNYNQDWHTNDMIFDPTRIYNDTYKVRKEINVVKCLYSRKNVEDGIVYLKNLLKLKQSELALKKKSEVTIEKESKIKCVNKTMWNKFLAFKEENKNDKFRNKIKDPSKRSYNIYKYEKITKRKRAYSKHECKVLINAN